MKFERRRRVQSSNTYVLSQVEFKNSSRTGLARKHIMHKRSKFSTFQHLHISIRSKACLI